MSVASRREGDIDNVNIVVGVASREVSKGSIGASRKCTKNAPYQLTSSSLSLEFTTLLAFALEDNEALGDNEAFSMIFGAANGVTGFDLDGLPFCHPSDTHFSTITSFTQAVKPPMDSDTLRIFSGENLGFVTIGYRASRMCG